MRVRAHRLPALVSPFPFPPCHTATRSCTHSSSRGEAALSVTVAPTLHLKHGPRDRLTTSATANEAASASPAPPTSILSTPAAMGATSTFLPKVKLSSSAAALLERRSRESVLRQDVAAADLLYFMSAEANARRVQGRRAGSSPAAGSDNTSTDAASMPLSSSSQATQLADSIDERGHCNTGHSCSAADHSEVACLKDGDHSKHRASSTSAATSRRFRQQQTLFGLRRRLAYMLAGEYTSIVDDGVRELQWDATHQQQHLAAMARRVALSLSLAESVCDTSAAPQNVNEGRGGTGGERRSSVAKSSTASRSFATWRRERESGEGGSADSGATPWSSERQDDTALYGDAEAVEAEAELMALWDASPTYSARCAFAYRSLAQPLELTRVELDALLEWCARQVTTYSDAVSLCAQGHDAERPNRTTHAAGGADVSRAQTGNRSRSVSAGAVAGATHQSKCASTHERVVAVNVGQGSTTAAPLPQASQASSRISGAHSPSTMQMAAPPGSSFAEAVVECADEGGADGLKICDREQTTLIPPSVCEGLVTATITALEFAAHFVRLAARVVLTDSAGVSSLTSKEDKTGDVDLDTETFRRGQLVCNVVDAACAMLDEVDKCGVLASYRRHATVPASGRSPASRTTTHRNAAVPVVAGTGEEDGPSVEVAQQLRDAFTHLSFTDAFMRDVLCCTRESWSLSLQVLLAMQRRNERMRRALTVSPTMSQSTGGGLTAPAAKRKTISASNADPASTDSLSALPVRTMHLLLFVLAQHGRLAEVLSLCRVCLNISSAHFFHTDAATSTTHDERVAAPSDEAVLRHIVHVAAANAAPDTASRILQSLVGAEGATQSPAAATMNEESQQSRQPSFSQADAVESIVRAGVMPQRVLGVTEYAMLLRRMLGDHHCIRSTENKQKPRESGPAAKARSSCSVGWWLSPSQVWRFSAGYPHVVRTTLCLTGFHVGARRGFADTLSLEDLYVVLSITRQAVASSSREINEHLQRAVNRDTQVVRGGKPSANVRAALFAGLPDLHRRRAQRWASWGVEEWVPLSAQQRQPQNQQLHVPSQPPLSETDASHFYLLPVRRRSASHSAHHVKGLCTAFDSARRGSLPFADSPPRTPSRRHGSSGSAVLLSLVSREMLAVLQAVRYTRHIGDYWSTALSTVLTSLQSAPGEGPCSSSMGSSSSVQQLLHHTAEVDAAERRAAEGVVEEVAYALANDAESSLADSVAATARLVAPLPSLAPYLSAYTVSALVQRPFRRVLTWEQCLALLPYTPLGSRSQLWLLRRVAQDGEGRRHAFTDAFRNMNGNKNKNNSTNLRAQPSGFHSARTQTNVRSPVIQHNPFLSPPPPPPSPPPPSRPSPALTFSQKAVQTAEKLMEVQHHARRLQQRTQQQQQQQQHDAMSGEAPPAAADASLIREAKGNAAAAQTPSSESDAALLTLLLEGHWSRALRVFEEAAPRVQVAGAPHVVRLLISADVWRDLADTQRRPLVRLAVQSSTLSGGGGAAALLEEVLQTSLEHGLWHTGLYFHQSVAAEQPDLVRQCRRAQVYAAQLCRGLLERTTMTLTVAQVMKAARRSQWADAAACFMRYATHSAGSLLEETSDESTASTVTAALKSPSASLHGTDAVRSTAHKRKADPKTTDNDELRRLIVLMEGGKSGERRRAADAPPAPVPVSKKSAAAAAFFADGGGVVPAELAHVAQTVRYAMLHTPALWMHALRWLPTSSLPLPYTHEKAIRALCRGNPAKLAALLPPRATTITANTISPAEMYTPPVNTDGTVQTAVVSAAQSSSFLSIVADARRSHRPQHPNEGAKEKQLAVAEALHRIQHAGAWEEAMLLYETATEAGCMPYAATTTVLETAVSAGAPWEVTLFYFFHMAQHLRPNVAATALALQACAEGGQWEQAFKVLQQSLLTQSRPVPRLVDLAVHTALHCGVWARALAAAHQYRRTRDPRLAHTVLLTFVRTQHWDDAVEFFYDCTCRGVRPLDASLELAITASEAASAEYRKTALMVGSIASALEDLYKLSGAVLEHILFVQRHVRGTAAQWPAGGTDDKANLSTDVRSEGMEKMAAVSVMHSGVSGKLPQHRASHLPPRKPITVMLDSDTFLSAAPPEVSWKDRSRL